MKLLNHKLKMIFDSSVIQKFDSRIFDIDNQIVICKFYLPQSSTRWYVFAGEKYFDNDYLFFGAVHLGTDVKFGYFMFSDLKKIRGANRTRVIRDESVFNQLYCNLY